MRYAFVDAMTDKKYSTAIFAVLLAALAAAVYWQSTGFELVDLDDLEYTVYNPIVSGGLTWTGIKAAFTQFSQKYWIPVTWLSYMADVSVSGMSPAAFHRTNVILHSLNASLVFLLFRFATGSGWKSFFAAALWALHPLRVESVAWVTERKDVLAGFFFLLALLGHFRYVKTEKKLWLAAIALCALLGLMAKPVVMVLPVAMLLLDFWPLGRFPEGGFKANPKGCGRLLLEKAHLFALSVVFVIVTVRAQAIEGAFNVDAGRSGLYENLATAVKAYSAYLYETVWPAGLFVRGQEYVTHFGYAATALCLGGLVLVSFLAFRFRKSCPELAFGWFWYLLILFPNSGIVQAGMNTFSDRFTYLPHVGLTVGAVWGAERLYSRFFADIRPLVALCAVLLTVLPVLSYRQTGVWRDDFTLFGYIDRVTGGRSALAKSVLGGAFMRAGKYQEAYDNYSYALRLDPYTPRGNGDKGMAAAKLGRFREAADLYRMELRASPGDRQFCIRLANVLIVAGDLPGAARQGLENIRQWPGDKEAWEAVNYLGGEEKAKALAKR
ncbi:tetratricopeptide repeat protein [bacterium]|nr:MAG: tetratricopeptide repeat protein [bacterium]